MRKTNLACQLLFSFILFQIIFSSPSLSTASELWNNITGATKVKSTEVSIFDSDTQKPIWGAHVALKYHKKMTMSKRKESDINYECKGEVDGVTDRNGKAALSLKTENCPTHSIENEELFITVTEPGYAEYHKKIDEKKIDVALERLGYVEAFPPINIQYPQYAIDIEIYKKNFNLINEGNKKNYLIVKYSQEDNLEKFLEKVAFVSNINSIPFLRELLDNKYSSIYKRATKDDESRRLRDYIGQKALAKALINIADDRVAELLPLSTNIPSSYLKFFSEAGIRISPDDYWDYLSGKYVSRAHNFLKGYPPSLDPLTFVIFKTKESFKNTKYLEYHLSTLYQLASVNNTDKQARKIYNWQIDKDRIASELIEIDFTSKVKILLKNSNTEKNDILRNYLLYLYKQREYEYLAIVLKEKKNLMNAFLAEDVKESTQWNTTTNENKDLGIEECLITKMPKVTEKIKKEIEAYLIETSISSYFYRWLVRNLSFVNRSSAENVVRKIYSEDSSKKINDYSYTEGKRAALRGAAEGKLQGLCSDVYDDLRIKATLKKDYFSLAEYRMFYLYSSCPSEFNKIVDGFNVYAVKEQMKKKTFEPSEGFDYEQKNFRNSIWQSVEKYFPKDKAERLLGEYLCNDNEIIKSIYSGSNIFPNKYPIKCICEKFEKDLPTLKGTTVSILSEYLDKCYPDLKQAHWRIQLMDWDREITDRTYKGLTNVVKGRKGFSPPTQIFDEKYRAFFIGTSNKKFKVMTMIDWFSGIDSNKAFPVLEQAINSQDLVMVRAALYAYSFYPSKYTPQIISRLKDFASQNKYPEYLYAAYSMAMNNSYDESARTVCKKASAYHINMIENRALNRYDSDFAFNVLLNLESCARVNDEEQYLQLLHIIFRPDSMGRYELFQKDLERIIISNDINVDKLIERLFSSTNAIEIILGIRLAELKKYELEFSRLEKMLVNDDSYVRLAAANYIEKNKEHYIALDKNLKRNTNIKIRRGSKELNPILDKYGTEKINTVQTQRIGAGD